MHLFWWFTHSVLVNLFWLKHWSCKKVVFLQVWTVIYLHREPTVLELQRELTEPRPKNRFVLSSHLHTSPRQVAGSSASFLCFGPLVSDGYGVCYNPRAADMLFPCSALRSCPTTSAPAFRDSLERSLLDMRALALQHSNNPKLWGATVILWWGLN